MFKKVALSFLALFIVGSVVLFFWARSVFTQDYVRTALAEQIGAYLGQPVTIGRIAARIYPRVTVDLGAVTIGKANEIQVETLHVGTNFRALLSRHIEGADLEVNGARVQLPLIPLGGQPQPGSTGPAPAGTGGAPQAPNTAGSAPASTGSESPVTIVSIDQVLLRDVELVSGGRTLRADIEAVPKGDGVVLRKVTVAADDTSVDATGEITSLAGPVGHLTLTAGTVDLDHLLLFLGAFAAGAGNMGGSSQAASAAQPAHPARLDVSITADRAKSGALVLDKLAGKALVTNDGVTINPVTFGLFDGRYDGTLAVSLAGGTPAFRGNATVSNIDMAALVAYAGSPGTISGRMGGKIDLAGTGADLGAATRSARGTARVDITDGVIPNLNLVRNVILATSGRADSTGQAAAANTGGEKFTRLGATMAIAGGQARTNDLKFESPDVLLDAAGTVALDGTAVNLAGNVQLSEALSAQAGRDLVRYTAQAGRVTLPATVTGPPSDLSVRVDIAGLAGRALRNKATEEINRAIERNLGNLFKRPPK